MPARRALERRRHQPIPALACGHADPHERLERGGGAAVVEDARRELDAGGEVGHDVGHDQGRGGVRA